MAPELVPDLTVIIPALNEAAALPGLLADLQRQRGVSWQIIVADGGSTDATPAHAVGERVELVTAPRGRARQMNAALVQAKGALLLFLHADSRLDDEALLARALAEYREVHQRLGHDRIAGHFPLRFIRADARAHRYGYRYMEEKSVLNRPYCQNGDQGLLISRGYFESLGRFDESRPYFEDLRIAEQVHATGLWITLPGALHTSARRFEREGFFARYRLMGLMVAAHGMGLTEFFVRARDLYADPDRGGRLQLSPYLDLLARLRKEMGWRQTWRALLRLGRFSRQHWWQVFFALDIALRPLLGPGRYPMLRFYDRAVYPLTANVLGDGFSALFAWAYAMVWLRLRMAISRV